MHEIYGPIVRLWLGPTQMLVSVKDIAMIEDMLVKAEDKLPLIGRAFRLAFGRSTLFVSSFEKVQRIRESLEAYMNENLLERMNQVPGKVVECISERFDSIITKDVCDSRRVSQHIAYYILGSSMFGDAFMNWSNAPLYEELLVTVAKEACYWASYRIPPFWSRRYWKYYFTCKRLKELNENIIDKSLRNRNVATKCNWNLCEVSVFGRERVDGAACFMDAMMLGGSLFNGKTEKHNFSKEEECGNILGLMFHGYLTTASLINNILTRLSLCPELQENIYCEIASLKKKTSDLDRSDVQKMNLLLATLYESARLLPPGPFLQRCSLKHDLRLKSSITVPAGTILVVPLPLVHIDYSIWGKDADQFNPRHFLPKTCSNKDGTLDKHDVPKEITSEHQIDGSFLSFGCGSRSCVGQKFAILEIAALFASLLSDYEIRLHPASDNDFRATLDGCCPNIFFIKRSKI
ncbi:cytochrome P450 734A5-like isoform X2 [Phalaenopsis equestris]|uniref:cytochrome P450 734A5-like isoform X2 n=2 Tax=Phalaenopsis equestris TaxID=78828 RepID=UPI0009E53040|nr:cytochrome P450 734A5-like isoform X2 [Phalaenopsis equestris]